MGECPDHEVISTYALNLKPGYFDTSWMTTPGMFESSRGPLGLILGGCALTGVILMGVPCGSNSAPAVHTQPELPQPDVTKAFVPSNARVDDSISTSEAVTLSLDGVDGTFVFVGGQRWLDYEDGSARLLAEVADADNSNRRFALNLHAVDRRSAGDLGDDAFRLDMEPTAYKAAGGLIDPDLWVAYKNFDGSMIGLGDLAGTELTVELERDTVLQIGEGANGANVYYGASARLLWHRASGAGLPAGGEGRVALTLQADSVARATGAQPEAPFKTNGNGHAVYLPGIAKNMVFAAGGTLTERPDGTGRLAGVIVEAGNPSRSFHLELNLTQRVDPGGENYPPSDSPKLELKDGSYVPDGPIDSDTWSYYEGAEGTLIGLGEFTGAVATIERRGPAFQRGLGANGKNSRDGAAIWLSMTVNVQPTTGVTLPASVNGDINIDLDDSGTSSCATAAVRDDGARFSAGHAFWIPGLAEDFHFQPGATFVERADGSARLDGVLYSLADPTLVFLAGVDFADRIDPQAPGHAPPGSPKLELPSSAYVSNGGTVDPNGWHYYANTLGELQGLGRMSGARLQVERRDSAFQVGVGANSKNTNFGGSGWLNVAILDQPQSGPNLPSGVSFGDINIDLGDECVSCAVAAEYDEDVSVFQGGHAFYLPGISHDFFFETGATFAEKSDGTALMSGILFSPTRPGWRFRAEVAFTGRVDPGQADYPPSGSPKKELIPAAFVDQGGSIDPNAWRYYEEYAGELIGLEALEGAQVHVERVGPAFQVGDGADGKNLDFGAAGWIAVTLVDQPTTGVSLPSQLADGDINVDLTSGCTLCAVGAYRDSAISTLPGQSAFFLGDVGSQWFDFEGPASLTEHADGTASLSGVLVDAAGGDCRFAVNLEFSGLAVPMEGDDLPEASPKRDLIASQYADNGGPVDFLLWRYYQHIEGELIGLGGHEGALVRLSRSGPSVQLGFGANGANMNWGASGWLETEIVSQPITGQVLAITSGDFNVDLGTDCGICATAAILDPDATSNSGDHAFYFPGIGTDYVFEGAAPFIEHEDGTATLTGVIFRPGDTTRRFRVEVEFSGRVDPGMDSYPPVGSPKLELRTPYYLASGGIVDPSAWHYYEEFEGRAFGLELFEGAELYYSRMGSAFQVGPGASGKNVDFGASGWINIQIVQQPLSGPQLSIPEGFHGDINVNLSSQCPDDE